MEPVVVSTEDYLAGNYPKNTPIMVGMNVDLEGRGGLAIGKKKEPTKIVIRMQKA